MNAQRLAWSAALLALGAMLGGCDRFEGGSTAMPAAQANIGIDVIAAVPLGDVAGTAASHVSATIPNPLDQPEAVQQGFRLYVKMNCAGCHGYSGEGGIGPPLSDSYWRYGGAPVSIFKSIYEGRPQGMPAWNPALPPSEIWKIVAWIESLGGGYAADGYQASLQGDLPGDNVSSHAKRTISAEAKTPAPQRPTMDRSAAPAPSRPDPGGNK